MLYDIDELFEDLDIGEDEKRRIIAEIKEEFPHDEMLFELHLFRTIEYLKKKDHKIVKTNP